MTGQPLDPAAIMAAHEDHVWPNTRGCLYADMDRDKPETQRCVPHRLAAALAATQERAGQADERAEQSEDNAQRESDRYIAMRAERDRLAAALAAAQERLAQVIATLDSVDPTRSASIMLTAVYRAVGVSPHRDLRAALTGEGE